MLPGNTVSSIAFGGVYVPPDDQGTTALVDYERGGVALNNTSEGLMSYTWRCYLDNINVMAQRNGAAPVLLFQQAGISELALCFDQNMRYCVAFIQGGVLKLRWFDSVAGAVTTTTFEQAVNPKLTLDDKRLESITTSDMILAYVRGRSLYYRQQRDRFTIERLLKDGLFPDEKLKTIGMNKNLRLQFEMV